MDKNDFKKGQTVYLKYVGDRRHGAVGSIKEVTVKSIGSKYITTTEGEHYTERKFEIDNDFYEHYTIGGSDYKLYATKQDIFDENETEEIVDFILSQFPKYGGRKTKFTLDQLRRIKSIIDEK